MIPNYSIKKDDEKGAFSVCRMHKDLEKQRRKVAREHQTAKERAHRSALNRASYQRRKLRLEDAMQFLTDAGYVENVDFYRYNALQFLDSITDVESGVVRVKEVQL